jgi:hypothetical protein
VAALMICSAVCTHDAGGPAQCGLLGRHAELGRRGGHAELGRRGGPEPSAITLEALRQADP